MPGVFFPVFFINLIQCFLTLHSNWTVNMNIPILTDELIFPPVTQTGPTGIVAIGGDVTPQRILLAYQMGIFPW